MVVSSVFFHPYLGKIPNFTDIFHMGLKPPTSFPWTTKNHEHIFPKSFFSHGRNFVEWPNQSPPRDQSVSADTYFSRSCEVEDEEEEEIEEDELESSAMEAE